MPVNKPTLKKRTRRYTMQDYYDGKCTKEGFPLDTPGAKSYADDEAAKNVPPEQETTTAVNPSPVADETQQTATTSSPPDSQPQADNPEPVIQGPGEEAPK